MSEHGILSLSCTALALAVSACSNATTRAAQHTAPAPAPASAPAIQWSGDTTGLGAVRLQLDSALAGSTGRQAPQGPLDRQLVALHQAIQPKALGMTQDTTGARLSLSLAALHQALRTGIAPR